MGLVVDFVGAATPLVPGETFVIGREGDLVVDVNPFLHRQFLTLTDPGGVCVLPIVFEETIVRFTAGPTTYEILLCHDEPAFRPSPLNVEATDESGGATTIGRVLLTYDQQVLILALAEAGLKSGG